MCRWVKCNSVTRRVESRRRCECTRRQSWLSLRFPVLLVIKWRHNDIMMPLLKSYQYRPKSTWSIRTAIFSFKIVDRIRRQSSWASCEFCSHRRRQLNSWVESRRQRRRCVLGLSLSSSVSSSVWCWLITAYNGKLQITLHCSGRNNNSTASSITGTDACPFALCNNASVSERWKLTGYCFSCK